MRPEVKDQMAPPRCRRLCGQDFSFCGGYALTKVYSRLDRLHKNAILGRVHQWLIKDFLGQQNIHPDIPSKKIVALVAAKKWFKT